MKKKQKIEDYATNSIEHFTFHWKKCVEILSHLHDSGEKLNTTTAMQEGGWWAGVAFKANQIIEDENNAKRSDVKEQ